MTEQEANKKWCPMSRNPHDDHCMSSDCAMWRWSITGATVNGKYDDNYPVEGYCGLAGKP